MSTNKKMPVLFIGHGSPLNAIEQNKYTTKWEQIASEFPKPKAILSISAHWYTDGSRINDATQPKMIYDMYGFPNELYEFKYPAKGSPELSHQAKNAIKQPVTIDNSWGIDHGTWSILCKMYPQADIPVVQLSIDKNIGPQEAFEIGRNLADLREDGILLIGSGNIVHNLSLVDWDMAGGYEWANEFDESIKSKITLRNYSDVMNYKSVGASSKLAFTTPDHFYPIFYILGASSTDDKLTIFNDSRTMGSLSMTSYMFR